MSFLKQFHTITQDLNVKNISNRLLEEGKKDSLFVDYFGVNFNETNLTYGRSKINKTVKAKS